MRLAPSRATRLCTEDAYVRDGSIVRRSMEMKSNIYIYMDTNGSCTYAKDEGGGRSKKGV